MPGWSEEYSEVRGNGERKFRCARRVRVVISRPSGHRLQPAVILSWSGHRRGRSRVESGPLEIAWCYSLLRRCDSGASGATGADVFIIAAEWGSSAACIDSIS